MFVKRPKFVYRVTRHRCKNHENQFYRNDIQSENFLKEIKHQVAREKYAYRDRKISQVLCSERMFSLAESPPFMKRKGENVRHKERDRMGGKKMRSPKFGRKDESQVKEKINSRGGSANHAVTHHFFQRESVAKKIMFQHG